MVGLNRYRDLSQSSPIQSYFISLLVNVILLIFILVFVPVGIVDSLLSSDVELDFTAWNACQNTELDSDSGTQCREADSTYLTVRFHVRQMRSDVSSDFITYQGEILEIEVLWMRLCLYVILIGTLIEVLRLTLRARSGKKHSRSSL